MQRRREPAGCQDGLDRVGRYPTIRFAPLPLFERQGSTRGPALLTRHRRKGDRDKPAPLVFQLLGGRVTFEYPPLRDVSWGRTEGP